MDRDRSRAVARRGARRAVRPITGLSRPSLALAAVALAAGVAVYAVATTLFPYHSVNHDEGVYLQQAAMLLDGRLAVRPPVPDAVRPWFFVADGGRLYPKYAPVAAALFAPGLAVGAPRLVLAAVAAANVALVGLLAGEALDARAAPVAAALFASAPLFLMSSSVFLAYAPTTLFNLLFALGYVRAHRRASARYAVLAGAAAGVAFFSRPYTAVLFALPFVAHAVLELAAAWRDALIESGSHRGSADSDGGASADRARASGVTARLGAVAALGTAFVGLTLGYNWLLTGDPLRFPYQAFAPADGIGFGHREILGHELVYDPALAFRSNGLVLRAFLTRWGPLGPLGSGLAAVGLATGLAVPLGRRLAGGSGPASDADPRTPGTLTDLQCRALLAGVAVSVAAGNLLFWGNRNVLAALEDPTDGLLAFLGPFYHFDLLVPVAVFGAAGTLALAEGARRLAAGAAGAVGSGTGKPVGRVLLAVALVAALAVAGVAESTALRPPVERNAEYRDAVGPAYEPFESTDLENALVFVPTPYGDWLNHPFQWLRNDPSFRGNVVYVLDRDAPGDAASLAAFSNRDPYRFTYRGTWPPGDDGVTPVLEPLAVREGERLRVTTHLGVVTGARSATVRLAAGGESVLYGVDRVDGETATVEWVVGPDRARLDGDGLRRFGDGGRGGGDDDAGVPLDGPTEVSLAVTFTQPGGATVTYRQDLTVVRTGDAVAVLWPPSERVCQLTPDCGREGTYVAGGDYVGGVSLASSLEASSHRANATAGS